MRSATQPHFALIRDCSREAYHMKLSRPVVSELPLEGEVWISAERSFSQLCLGRLSPRSPDEAWDSPMSSHDYETGFRAYATNMPGSPSSAWPWVYLSVMPPWGMTSPAAVRARDKRAASIRKHGMRMVSPLSS